MKPEDKDYAITTDVKYGFQELIDIHEIQAGVRDDWYNETLCKVNDSVARLGVVKGEFHWHKHDNEDEFFLCIDGVFYVEIENGPTFELKPQQSVCVRRGVVHRTRAPERTTVLMIASAGVVPTGD